MLALLVKHAQEQNLVAEPGFAPKTVKWCLAFDGNGQFLGILRLGNATDKRNPGLQFQRCPDLPPNVIAGGGEPRSHFLIETAKVVCLLFKDEKDRTENEQKIRGKHQFFVKLLTEADTEVNGLAQIGAAIADKSVLQKIQSECKANGVKPSDKVTISIDGLYPVESDTWHNWWRQFRTTLTGSNTSSDSAICFVTGEPTKPIATHPKIKGLRDVGGIVMGDVLVGFDKDAFTSFGLEQSANCAVGEDAASAYCAALNHLIETSSKPVAGAKIAYWFSKPVPKEDDWLGWLKEPPEKEQAVAKETAKRLIEAIQSGKRPELADNYYYAMTVSGAGGRVIVRDWMYGRFEDLVSNVCKWFSDLEITNFSGRSLAKDPGLDRVVTSLLRPRRREENYTEWVRPVQPFVLSLWQTALNAQKSVPCGVLGRLVLLHTRFVLSGDMEKAIGEQTDDQDRALLRSILYARMGIIKAYHIRKNGGNGTLTAFLNEDHPHPAYHCGRLMAMLAALQRRALGDVGTGVVQRFYAAASATPALVLGRLMRTSQFHLDKLEPGLANWYRNRMAQVWSRIKDYVPATLTPEEQSLFALGYYQQIAYDNSNKSEDKKPSGQADLE